MYLADHEIAVENIGIAGAETDCLLLQRDRLVYLPSLELAHAESKVCTRCVAIRGNHRLEFGNGLVTPPLRPQQLTFGHMRRRVPGGCRQSLVAQSFRACDIGVPRAGHSS